MRDDYEDIINLPRHTSLSRPGMSMLERAAQFSAFAALTGYDEAVKETARLTDDMIELEELQIDKLNEALQRLNSMDYTETEVRITYFEFDDRKTGGRYLTITGFIKKIDSFERRLIMRDGSDIDMDSIRDIDILL